jgi:hypothetical protein
MSLPLITVLREHIDAEVKLATYRHLYAQHGGQSPEIVARIQELEATSKRTEAALREHLLRLENAA